MKVDNFEVLIVDDDPTLLETVKDTIGDKFKLHTATSAEDALFLKEKNSAIMVVITDINMPNMNGISLCRVIKKSSPMTVVIGLTGEYGLFNTYQAREAGFDDFFIKPIRFDELEQAIEEAMNRFRRWFQDEN